MFIGRLLNANAPFSFVWAVLFLPFLFLVIFIISILIIIIIVAKALEDISLTIVEPFKVACSPASPTASLELVFNLLSGIYVFLLIEIISSCPNVKPYELL